MKTVKWFLIGGVLIMANLIFQSCTGDCVPEPPLPVVFTNAQKKNLLDYSTPNHYYMKDIKIYRYVNKVKTLYLDSLNNEDQIFSNYPSPELLIFMKDNTMLLELSPTVTDTITCTKSGYCPPNIDRAWYNGTLVYDRASKFQDPVVIVK